MPADVLAPKLASASVGMVLAVFDGYDQQLSTK